MVVVMARHCHFYVLHLPYVWKSYSWKRSLYIFWPISLRGKIGSLWYIFIIQKVYRGTFLVKMDFSAQQAKNGLPVPIKQYQQIDQMDSIWWNNFIMNGVKAFILNLNSIGQRQHQNGRVFSKSLGTGSNL